MPELTLAQALPVALPARSALAAATKKVMVEWDTYKISQDNLAAPNDFYTKAMLSTYDDPSDNPNIAYGPSGGRIQDRPIDTVTRPAAGAESVWIGADMLTDARWIDRMGADSVSMELWSMTTTDPHWVAYNAMLTAMGQVITEDSSPCRVCPCINLTSVSTINPTDTAVATSLANLLAPFATNAASYRLNAADTNVGTSRMVIALKAVERASLAWLTTFRNRLVALGVSPFLVSKHISHTAFMKDNAGLDIGELIDVPGLWGPRQMGSEATWATAATSAREYGGTEGTGKLFGHPIRAQDYRPRGTGSSYVEPNNTGMLFAAWASAVSNGDWAHIITWNRYDEGHAIRPSQRAGFLWYDLNAIKIAEFKGFTLNVERNVGFYSYRLHRVGAVPTGTGATTAWPTAPVGPVADPLQNQIELRSYGTGNYQGRILGTDSSVLAPGTGERFRIDVPNGGTPSFVLFRDTTNFLTWNGHAALLADNAVDYKRFVLYGGSSSRVLETPGPTEAAIAYVSLQKPDPPQPDADDKAGLIRRSRVQHPPNEDWKFHTLQAGDVGCNLEITIVATSGSRMKGDFDVYVSSISSVEIRAGRDASVGTLTKNELGIKFIAGALYARHAASSPATLRVKARRVWFDTTA